MLSNRLTTCNRWQLRYINNHFGLHQSQPGAPVLLYLVCLRRDPTDPSLKPTETKLCMLNKDLFEIAKGKLTGPLNTSWLAPGSCSYGFDQHPIP